MPANYMHRIIDKIGNQGTLKKQIQIIYDENLHIVKEIVYKNYDLSYLPVPAKIANKLLPEGHVKGVNTAIWVDPDFDIDIREGFDPDVVVLSTGITYRIDEVDELSILNHGYKTLILVKIEDTLT